jgi:hypothetical protein
MTITDRFSSAQAKISRARKHTDDLESEIRAYWKTGPVSAQGSGVVPTENGGTGARTFTVENIRPLPESIALLVGDAAHNIRSALDHFACAAVARPTRQTCFPIWSRDNPHKAAPKGREWLEAVQRQLDGASPELIKAAQTLTPWETGNDKRLWQIHELDRIDKHRLLISVAAANTAVLFDLPSPVLNPVPGFRPTMPLAVGKRKWTPLEPGAVLWDVPEGSAPGPDPMSFEYDITLAEPADLKGLPVVAQLRILANHAETSMQMLAPVA